MNVFLAGLKFLVNLGELLLSKSEAKKVSDKEKRKKQKTNEFNNELIVKEENNMKQNTLTKEAFEKGINGNILTSIEELKEKGIHFGTTVTTNKLLIRKLSQSKKQIGFLFIHFEDGMSAYPLFQCEDDRIAGIYTEHTVQFNRFVKDFLVYETMNPKNELNVLPNSEETMNYVLDMKYTDNKRVEKVS